MTLMIRACCLSLALLSGTLWPALPGLGAGASGEHGPAWSSDARITGGAHTQHPAPPKDQMAQCLQDQMNGTRAAHGLPALPEIPLLLEVAQRHSDKMAAEESMQHSTGEVFPSLPPGWRAYGENVVYGKTCEQMYEALLASESHRDALLRPDFNVSGIAVSTGGDGWIYATMVFLDLPVLPPSLPPPPDSLPAPSPLSPSMSPAPQASPAPSVPGPSPGAEPIATISLMPLRREAHPGEDGALNPGSKAKNPRPPGQSSARKAQQRNNDRPVPTPAPLSSESSVWVLDDEAPGPLPPEPEPDPSQMIFELEGTPAA